MTPAVDDVAPARHKGGTMVRARRTRRYKQRSPETVDRIFVGACAAIWLVLVSVSVIAFVALVDLGRGHPHSSTLSNADKQTPWLLYTIIVVSILAIIGAAGLVIQTRRTGYAATIVDATDRADSGDAPQYSESSSGSTSESGAQEHRVTVFGHVTDVAQVSQQNQGVPALLLSRPFDSLIATSELDRVWLRGTAGIAGASGLALIAVAIATVFLAVGGTTAGYAAWIILGIAAAMTVAIPGIPVRYLRQLRQLPDIQNTAH